MVKVEHIYVLSSDGKPLMPTTRRGRIRKLLKAGEAKIVGHNPLVVQLVKMPDKVYVQKGSGGLDEGFKFIGLSGISASGKELHSAEIVQRNDIKDLLDTKRAFRKQRRSRLRHREARFNNRKKDILRLHKDDVVVLQKDINETFYKYSTATFSHFDKETNSFVLYNANGESISVDKKDIQLLNKSLPPSIQNKKNAHFKAMERLMRIMPIKEFTIEIADFDIQKIKNPEISGTSYQMGEQYGFENVRQYVFHRDGHKCQNPNCKNKDLVKILRVHHIIFRSSGGTDAPSNLITLCTKCHIPANHKPGNFLYVWMLEKKKVRGFKGATFMSIVKNAILNEARHRFPGIKISFTYGYITKGKRIALKKDNPDMDFEKTHCTDAFIIAGGGLEHRSKTYKCYIIRRNDRSLTSFKDAKYIDIRDGLEKSASELSFGRTCRNKNLNTENLRKYRGKKTRTGQYTAPKKQFSIKNGTIIRICEDWEGKNAKVKKNEIHTSSGHGGKSSIYIKSSGKKLVIPEKVCEPVYYKKGFVSV